MATVLGVFSDQVNASGAIRLLEEKGYNPREISIIMKDQGQMEKIGTGPDVAGGAVSGATAGGIIGALAGLLFATGIIPEIGALLIGGPIAATLGLTGAAATTVSGAVTGALAGGLIGALTSLGLSEDEARIYEERIREGGILIAVPSKIGDELDLKNTLERYGAHQIKTIPDPEEEETTSVRSDFFAEENFYPMGIKGGESSDITDRDKEKPLSKRRRP